MVKSKNERPKMSAAEWESLPITFDSKTMARVCGSYAGIVRG